MRESASLHTCPSPVTIANDRLDSEKAVRKEMLGVPPEVPYTVLELVGKGSFGSVFKGMHNETKQIVAVKSLDLDQHDDEIKDIQKEIGLLSQLKAGDAPNITAFHGSFLLGSRLWIIIDFCSGGSVRTLVCFFLAPLWRGLLI